MKTLGGYICIRNGLDLDYCFKEAIESLLPVCDMVGVSDAESTDGTQEFLRGWTLREPKLVLNVFPWTDPRGSNQWYPEWINYARQHLTTDMAIHLDADEVLHEDDYPLIKEATEKGSVLMLKRLNFWRDAGHLIPEGKCCGTSVLRFAPARMPIPSDYPYEPAAETMKLAAESSVRCFHYGFIRQRDAFFRKAREVQKIWVNSYDPRLEAAEKFDQGHWSTMPGITGWENDLVEYTGTHPAAAQGWLKARGYDA